MAQGIEWRSRGQGSSQWRCRGSPQGSSQWRCRGSPQRSSQWRCRGRSHSMAQHPILQGEWSQDVINFMECIDRLQQNRAHTTLLAHCARPAPNFQHIKLLSHHGANVHRGGIALDSGNICYTLVYVALESLPPLAGEEEALCLRAPLTQRELYSMLSTRWPTLRNDCLTTTGYVRKGDVIECFLALYRLDHGKVFPPWVAVAERRAWIDDMELACSCARRLLLILPKALPPSNMLCVIQIAYRAHRMPLCKSQSGRKKFLSRCEAYGDAIRDALSY